MTDPPFPLFHAAFPPSGERVPFDPLRHASWASKVPPELAAEWRSFGFGAYGEGLLWTPVPDEPFFDPADWPVLDGTGVEVLRTAFADACFWQGGDFLWLNVLSGRSFHFLPSAPVLFDSAMIQKDFRKTVLLERLFRQARTRLGELGREECYGFAPLPALGGAIAEEYLVKVRVREYLSLVAQAKG